MIVVTTPTGIVGAALARLLVEHTPPLSFRLAAHRPETIIQLFGSGEYPLVRLEKSGNTSQILEELLKRPATPLAQFVADYRQRWSA